jgi:hypothetical protein
MKIVISDKLNYKHYDYKNLRSHYSIPSLYDVTLFCNYPFYCTDSRCDSVIIVSQSRDYADYARNSGAIS